MNFYRSAVIAYESYDATKRWIAAEPVVRHFTSINMVHFHLMMLQENQETRKKMFAFIFEKTIEAIGRDHFVGLPARPYNTINMDDTNVEKLLRSPNVLGPFIQTVIVPNTNRMENYAIFVDWGEPFLIEVPNIIELENREERLRKFAVHFMEIALKMDPKTTGFESIAIFISQIQICDNINGDFMALASILLEAAPILKAYSFPSKITNDHRDIHDGDQSVAQFLQAGETHRCKALFLNQFVRKPAPISVKIFTDQLFIQNSAGKLLELMGVPRNAPHFKEGETFLSAIHMPHTGNHELNYHNSYFWVKSVSYIADVLKSGENMQGHIKSMLPLHSDKILASLIKLISANSQHIPGHFLSMQELKAIDFMAKDSAKVFYTAFMTHNFPQIKDNKKFVTFMSHQSAHDNEEFEGLARVLLHAGEISELDVSHFPGRSDPSSKFVKSDPIAFAQFLKGVVYEISENMRIAFFLKYSIRSTSLSTPIFTSPDEHIRGVAAIKYFLVTMREIAETVWNFAAAMAFLTAIVRSRKPVTVENTNNDDGHHEFLAKSAFRMADVLKSTKNHLKHTKSKMLPLYHMETITEIVIKVHGDPFVVPDYYLGPYIGIDIKLLYSDQYKEPYDRSREIYKFFLETDLDVHLSHEDKEKVEGVTRLADVLSHLTIDGAENHQHVADTLSNSAKIIDEYSKPTSEGHVEWINDFKGPSRVNMADTKYVILFLKIVLNEKVPFKRMANILRFGIHFENFKLVRIILFDSSTLQTYGAFVDLYWEEINKLAGKFEHKLTFVFDIMRDVAELQRSSNADTNIIDTIAGKLVNPKKRESARFLPFSSLFMNEQKSIIR